MTSEPADTVPATPTTSVRVAVIGGDGIGPEVTAEALKVLKQVAPTGVKFEEDSFTSGGSTWIFIRRHSLR